MSNKVIIVGSGNAALTAGIASLEKGSEVTIYEKADKNITALINMIIPETNFGAKSVLAAKNNNAVKITNITATKTDI